MTALSRSTLALGAAASVLAFAATPSFAQVDEAASGDVIVVTARRQEESLQTVPGAVSAFSQDQLTTDLAAENVGALQGLVPNLNLVQGRGSNSSANIYIRGVGQPDALQTFDPAVAVYVDDVFISRIRGALFDVYDVERIEVLRGPQGTLFGKNTNGGALRLITRKPGDEFEASGRFSFGSYNAIEASASLSGPIAPGVLAAGLSLYSGTRDGYVTDPNDPSLEYNNKDTRGARGTLRFTPRDDMEFVLAADYTKESPNLTVGQPVNTLYQVDLAGGAPILFTPSGAEYDFSTATSLTRGSPFLGSTTELQNSSELKHTGVSLTSTWELSDAWTAKSITARRDLQNDDYIDIDATAFEIGDVFVGVDQDQTSQEFQLLFDNGAGVRAVGGVFWMNENISSFQQAYADDFLLFGGFPVAFTRDISDQLNLHSWAGYANVVLDLTDRLSLTGGLRYTLESKHYDRETTTTFDPAGFGFFVQEEWDDWSPLVSADYQFNDNVFGYARFSSGFKSGGFNGRANNPNEQQPYAPETVDSYEAGLRTTWMGGDVILNGNVFYNDYQDFQARVSDTIDIFDPNLNVTVPTPVFTVLNAGSLEISGAELEFLARPTPELTLDASIGYLDAQYGEFLDARYPGGDRAPYETPAFAPDWTARFGAAYDFNLDDVGILTVGGDMNYRGDHWLSVDQSEQLLLPSSIVAPITSAFQDGYWLANARVVFAAPDGDWSIGLYGKNLGDEVYKTDFQEFSSVGGIRTAYFGAPQTVTLQITGRY